MTQTQIYMSDDAGRPLGQTEGLANGSDEYLCFGKEHQKRSRTVIHHDKQTITVRKNWTMELKQCGPKV
jgi:hypothetical protein